VERRVIVLDTEALDGAGRLGYKDGAGRHFQLLGLLDCVKSKRGPTITNWQDRVLLPQVVTGCWHFCLREHRALLTQVKAVEQDMHLVGKAGQEHL